MAEQDMQARLDRMAALLERYGITDTTTAPRRRAHLELVYTGPRRHRARAATALDDAGYTTQTSHNTGDSAVIAVHVDWTRDGPVDPGFQAEHLTRAGAAVEPFGYTLRTSAVTAGHATR